MNEILSQISDLSNPIALAIGIILIYQMWRLKNPICLIVMLLLVIYEARNLQSWVSITFYSNQLIRPNGLLVWSILGRVVEVSGKIIVALWFADRIKLKGFMRYFLTSEEMRDTPRQLAAGDMPKEFWVDNAYTQSTKALRDNIKEEFLK